MKRNIYNFWLLVISVSIGLSIGCSTTVSSNISTPTIIPSSIPQNKTSEPKETELTYLNPVYKWSISYPKDWSINTTDLQNVKFLKLTPDEGLISVHVSTPNYTNLNSLIDNYLEVTAKHFNQSEQKMVILTRQPLLLPNSGAATDVLFEIRPNGKSRYIFLPVDKRVFVIVAETYINKWEAVNPYFNQMISTFTVLK
jgi:hypothetical protein